MKKIKLLLLLISLFFLLSCMNGSVKSSKGKDGKLLPPDNNKIYFGAFPDFSGTEDNVSKERIYQFEKLIDKKIAWAVFSDNWYNGISYPKEKIDFIVDSGATPYVRIMPRSDDREGYAEEKFSMQNIIDGEFDSELIAWARACKADNIPLLMDFAVEANGDWFPWSGKFNGGGVTDEYGDVNYPDGPERYRDAYRHIIDVFRAEEVTNVTWFYHYNYAPFPNLEWNQPKYYYPGDDYIDWVGFSLYGAQTLDEEWEGLDFSLQLKDFFDSSKSLISNKPVALLEFGVTDYHDEGDKSIWLEDAFKTILHNPYMKFDAISIWHEDWQNEDETYSRLRVDSSEETLKTFKKLIKNDRFTSKMKYDKE